LLAHRTGAAAPTTLVLIDIDHFKASTTVTVTTAETVC
jgi:hypothetical protein